MTCKLNLKDLPASVGITLGIANIIIGLLAFSGNLFIFYIVIRNTSLRTRTVCCLISLTTTDFLVSLALEPLFIIQLLSSRLAINCELNATRRFLTAMLTGASMSTLAAISYDRFVHLSKTVNYEKHMTKTLMACLITLSWLLPFTSTFFKYIGEDELVYSASIFVYSLIMVSIILVSYAKIMKIIDSKRKSLSALASDTINRHAELRREQRLLRTQEKAAKAIRLIFLCFGLFIIPITAYHGIAIVSKMSAGRSQHSESAEKRRWMIIVYAVAMTISMGNSAINPVIYYFRIPEFKDTAKKVINTISVTSNREEMVNGRASKEVSGIKRTNESQHR